MKRSEINSAYRQAVACFEAHCWALPPNPRWDITDFGLEDFARHGLTLVNLADEPEYCEKLMYAQRKQRTPCHAHARKKEDIICRSGSLTIWLWPRKPAAEDHVGVEPFPVRINGLAREVVPGVPVLLEAGNRVTLDPGMWHAFAPASEHCIISEVSTANDDRLDNFFLNPAVGRFPGIVEDEIPEVRLVSES